jgi:hypothetical protein
MIMKNLYSFRDVDGKFTVRYSPKSIRPGALYKIKGYKNILVRAKKLVNGSVLVSYHGLLNAFLPLNKLEMATKEEVNQYLKET